MEALEGHKKKKKKHAFFPPVHIIDIRSNAYLYKPLNSQIIVLTHHNGAVASNVISQQDSSGFKGKDTEKDVIPSFFQWNALFYTSITLKKTAF